MRKHLTNEEIEQYIDSEYVHSYSVPEEEQLSVEEILKVEEHVLACDDCLKKVQKAIGFSHEYDTWMALKPTPQQRAVLESLRAVNLHTVYGEEVQGRLKKWMSNWKKLSAYTLDVIFNTTYQGAANITRIIKETAHGAKESIQFEHPVQCYAMRGTATEFKKEIKNQIIGIVDDASVVNINAQTETNSIRISFPAGKEEGRVPLILLIPVEQGEQSKMLKPELNSDTNQLEAVISNVNSGKYILAIEPLDLF
jgi:hypothetical protein